MNLVALTVAIVVIAIGVVFQQVRPVKPSDEIPQGSVLQSQDIADTPTPTPEVPHPTLKPTRIPTSPPIPTNTPQTQPSDFPIYPGASVVNSNDESMTLTSSDDADSITQWYKEYIETQHMNVKSFVTTKANDKVHNVLVGAGNGEIRITITKEPHEQHTTILISY